MKIVYHITLVVFLLLAAYLCVVGLLVAQKSLVNGHLPVGPKRLGAILSCVQPVALLLVTLAAGLALRMEIKMRANKRP